MTTSRKILAGAAVVLAALLVVFVRSCQPAPRGPLRVRIEADRQQVTVGGKVVLRGIIEPEGTPVATWVWSAGEGRFVGQGARTTWTAPTAAGDIDVHLAVVTRAGQHLQASLRLAAVDRGGVTHGTGGYRGPVAGYEIEEVELDKDEMCVDDDVHVQIKAHDPDGQSEWIVPVVRLPGENPATGFDVTARVGRDFLDGYVEGDTEHLVVELFDSRTASIMARKLVPFRTRRCQSEHAGLMVMCSDAFTSEEAPGDRLACHAAIHPVGKDFTPVRYEWRAGWTQGGEALDPVAATGQDADIPLPPRVQDRYTSSATVWARAYDASGRWIQGRTSASFVNDYWHSAQVGTYVQLMVTYKTNAIPVGDHWEQTVRVYNPNDETVQIDEVEERRWACEEGVTPQTPLPGPRPFLDDSVPVPTADKPDEITRGSADTYFGGSTLAPGEMRLVTVKRPADQKLCNLEIVAKGVGQTSGRPIFGYYAMRFRSIGWYATQDMNVALHQALAILSKRRGYTVQEVYPGELELLEKEGLIELPGPTDLPADIPPGATIDPAFKAAVEEYKRTHPDAPPRDPRTMPAPPAPSRPRPPGG